MQLTSYRPDRHVLQDTELARHLRRETGIKDVFTYWHTRAKSWVISVWINRGSGRFLEMFTTDSLAQVTRDDVQAVIRMLRNAGPRPKDLIREGTERLRDEIRREQEDIEEATRVKKWLGKKVAGIHADDPEWGIPGFPVSFGAGDVL